MKPDPLNAREKALLAAQRDVTQHRGFLDTDDAVDLACRTLLRHACSSTRVTPGSFYEPHRRTCNQCGHRWAEETGQARRTAQGPPPHRRIAVHSHANSTVLTEPNTLALVPSVSIRNPPPPVKTRKVLDA